MSYQPRRLRHQDRPVYVLQSRDHSVDAETAFRVRDMWRTIWARESKRARPDIPGVIVIDGLAWDVRLLTPDATRRGR